MTAYVRLVAFFVAAMCLAATTLTGDWSGPADLASVGEGHSIVPDRRGDELVDELTATGDVEADPRWPLDAVVGPPFVAVGRNTGAAASLEPAATRAPVMQRGPPCA